jgi:lysophospholipase L1-like esterase
MTWKRYVAIGDSQTEGLHDYDERGDPRGWADRLAARLAEGDPDFRYANLAVRGRRTAAIRAEQLAAALALEPDLASVVAGVNDVVHPGADIAAVARDLEAMYAALRARDCTVVGCTFPLPSVGLARRLRPRLRRLNAAIRAAAARHAVLLVDFEPIVAASDLRLWSPDRIHLNPLGHERLAAAFAATLTGSDEDSWKLPLPEEQPLSRSRAAAREAAWIARFMLPKVVRMARRRSSGDGRAAKRPALSAVEPGGSPPPRGRGRVRACF